MDLTLTRRDQSFIHRILVATPDPASTLLPTSAVDALVRLIPCDAIGAHETDTSGYVLRSFELPRVGGGSTAPACHTTALPGVRDTLRVGFSTPAGTELQLHLDRWHHTFSQRDGSILTLLGPALQRLMLSSPRLAGHADLSGCELRVLELVAAGATNRDVADQLCVTVATVRKHLEHAYRKLGVTNRTAAVAALSDLAVRPAAGERSRFG
jgi:DNA-binding CsgD family transcriptional regulator